MIPSEAAAVVCDRRNDNVMGVNIIHQRRIPSSAKLSKKDPVSFTCHH
jgi:hypothetical protein